MSPEGPYTKTELPKGVMLNAYPDSVGNTLVDTVNMLKRSEFKEVFSSSTSSRRSSIVIWTAAFQSSITTVIPNSFPRPI